MPRLLEPEQIEALVTELPGWSGDRSGLRRSVSAPTFLEGIRMVSDVADVAEGMDHHPDIDIRWRTVTFVLATHSAGGVTELDEDLARRITTIVAAYGAD